MRAHAILEGLLMEEQFPGAGLRLRRHGFRPMTDRDRQYLPREFGPGAVMLATGDRTVVYDFDKGYAIEYDRSGRSTDARHISPYDLANELDLEKRRQPLRRGPPAPTLK